MSDSRLEKFIYAICSMDVSDLPVPLSRIETLWNCLITGETPDFEPLSRNEKYLMAMLDRYDISNLPAPMSRGEQLLYKIAVGETDLSDVPGYLSRYEELLKYLIENGGISGGDFEYVLHTLNQSLNTLYLTAEKPVKSAILSGQTLVNLFDGEKMALNEAKFYTYSNGIIEGVGDGQAWSSKTNMCSAIKPITKYLFKVKNIGEYDLIVQIRTDLSVLLHSQLVSVGQEVIRIIQTGEKIDGLYVKVYPQTTNNGILARAKVNIIEYQDGMENWDIPYFEGMQSVKMPVLTTTGKNLFDGELEIGGLTNTNGLPNNTQLDRHRSKNYTKVKSSTKYVVYNNYSSMVGIRDFDEDYNLVSWSSLTSSSTYITSNNTKYLKFIIINTNDDNLLQLEEGSVATQYEPYKTNILTVNDEVELRGIGNVQDTLDCLTGEVTESIGEIVLDGNSDIEYEPDNGVFYIQLNTLAKISGDYSYRIVSDKGKVLYDHSYVREYEGTDLVISGYHDWEYPGENWLYFAKKDITSESDMKAWLAQNPVTIYYELAKPTTKFIDISTVDQDNQPTQLGTFENVTYVSLEAENLIPEVELEVATRISEELTSASPLMDDISTKQEQLNAMVDEQSENVDATMIATTEIYEETL